MKLNKNIFICVLLAVMVLFCISAVSAEDNQNADLGAVDASASSVDLSNVDIKGSEAQSSLGAGSSSVVTNDTFFNYFDKDGVINKSLTYNELIFDGEFSGLGIDTITIDAPITISSENVTVFNNIGFKIISDDVTLTGFDIVKTTDGSAITVKGDDVTIDDVFIDISSAGKNDTFAIIAVESDNLQLLNNIIAFNTGSVGCTAFLHAVDVRGSNNVNIKKNNITVNLPALTVNWYGAGINQDLPLAIGIQDCENVTFAENNVNAIVKEGNYYDTLDAMMVYGVKNLEITDNNFTETSSLKTVLCLYAVDLYNFNEATISGNTIVVNTTSGADGAGAAYSIQTTGPHSGVLIENNQLTAISNGPSLGIYTADWAGPTESAIIGNTIDVTGYASNGDYSLLSGMELQATVATIVGNNIFVKAINAYNDSNKVYGISYSQTNSNNHTFNVTKNSVVTDGKYTVYMGNVSDSTITDNVLYANDLMGDKSVVIGGESNVVENNYPPYDAKIIIDSPAVWTGNNGNISVVVANATGTVNIKVGNKIYENLTLVNGTVSQVVDAADLAVGANAIEVTYSGDDFNKAATAVGNLQVVDGVITADTFKYYFGEDKYLSDIVPEGATLDFQGSFISDNFTLYINKPVNVISSTGDALFDSNTTNRKWIMFNVVKGANNTNITGINFLNADLFIEAPYVTVDNISAVANMSGVGSGTGFVVFRTNAPYGTIKNSYLENGGTGASIIVFGYGAPYGTIDNNVINVTGSSGNIMGANAYVGTGVTPGNMTVTNNKVYNEQASTSTSYAVTLMGSYNVVENNTIKHKGSGIISANVQWALGPKDPSENNTYRNNVLIGCGISATKGSIVENNTMTAALSLGGADIVVIGNTAGSMTVGTTSAGGNMVVDNNTINGVVTINKAAVNTTFTNNYVKDTVTVNSNDNVITDNQISTEKAYAIDLKSTSGNTVKYNVLSSKDKMGDDAVQYAKDKNNTVKNNGMNAIITIEVANSWSGDNNTINITVVNATGTVDVNINGVEYKGISLVNGAAQFEIPANNIEVGLNNLTVTYSGNKVISSDSKDATFYGLDNVVFAEVFFDFFDENGILKDDVPYNDLIFKGAFTKAKTVQYIVIDKPVSISSDGASLSLMGIVIGSDNVTIDGLKLSATVNSVSSALGDLITVNANNVTLSNLDITYKVTNGNYDAIAIDAFNADNVKIINNNIIFESRIKTDDYSASAINLNEVTNALIDNNTITSTIPALTVDYDIWFMDDFEYYMMGHDYLNPIRIRASDNVTFTNNDLETKIYSLDKTTPTIETVLIIGSNNILFDSNTIKMIDTKSKAGDVVFIYALNFGYNDNLIVSNNILELSTKSGKDSSGAAYGIQGVESNITVIGNNITTVSNGPNLGYYVSSMWGGSSDSYVANNFINVTGYATSNAQWALVSGIEITNGAAVINNNTIYTYNAAGYVEQAPVHGVSYAQYMYGVRDIVVENNTIITQGKYTVSVLDGTNVNVTYNTLYAEELFGDDSVAPGYVGIVENNTPPFDAEIIIEGQPVWIGSNSTVTVTVPTATGNVTIVIGNKTYKEVPLVNGTVTVPVDAADLVGGANDVNVTYNGDLYLKVGNATGNLQVLDGVITNATYEYYFDNGYLVSIVPEGATLDFQGLFLGKYPVYIDKPVNAISSTGDALFDSGATYAGNAINSFNIIAGGDNTNITGLNFINYCLYIKGASNVTVDSVSIVANKRGVGSGTGFLSIHTGAYNTLVKNGYFENGGTGSSLLVLGCGGAYATFDHNVFNITGSSGNILSANQFVGSGAAPEHVSYTNNVLYNNQRGSAFCYAMTVSGSGNLVENNTIYHNGSGILNQYGASSTGNVYRNNTLYGNTNFNPSANSLVEGNKIYATTNIAANTTVLYNTFTTVAISGSETVFARNNVNGTVTVKGNENAIIQNAIVSTGDYAVDLGTTKDNNVTDNILYAKEFVGDNSVKFVEDKNNTVKDNYPIDPVLVVEAANIKVGENATINVSFAQDITADVEVIVNGKKYSVPVSEGKGQLNVSDLEAGDYTVGATYDGAVLYIPTEKSTTFTVEKEVSQASINISDVKLGEDANVTVSIPGATGNVSVIIDGIDNVIPLDENGTASYTIPAMTAGDHSVVVIYTGDDTHAATYKATQVSIEVSPTEFTNITIAGDLKVSAVLVDDEGNPVANAVIDYAINGVANSTVTGADGSFVIAGENGAVINIAYAGSDDLLATNTSITLANVAPVVVQVEARFNITNNAITIYGYAVDKKAGEQGIAYATTLLDADGNPISGAFIQFGLNSKIYNRTTNENGTFDPYHLNMVRAGVYTMAFYFAGNENYTSAFAIVAVNLEKKPITIKASAKTFKASAKTKKYTVTLSTIVGSSADGKAHLRTGFKVTMKINGQTTQVKPTLKAKLLSTLRLLRKANTQPQLVLLRTKHTLPQLNP